MHTERIFIFGSDGYDHRTRETSRLNDESVSGSQTWIEARAFRRGFGPGACSLGMTHYRLSTKENNTARLAGSWHRKHAKSREAVHTTT